MFHVQTDDAEADKRELALLKKAVEEAEASVERERQATAAAEARGAEDAARAASETEALREQLDNAVRRHREKRRMRMVCGFASSVRVAPSS